MGVTHGGDGWGRTHRGDGIQEGQVKRTGTPGRDMWKMLGMGRTCERGRDTWGGHVGGTELGRDMWKGWGMGRTWGREMDTWERHKEEMAWEGHIEGMGPRRDMEGTRLGRHNWRG